MSDKTMGFIGGGRVTRTMLGGFKRGGTMPRRVVVSDPNVDVLKNLKAEFPETDLDLDGNRLAAATDLVFLALHPPVLKEILAEIAPFLKPGAVVISLAPKVPLTALSEALGGYQRIVRTIPNAPSIVNRGHNPVAFSPAFSAAEKADLASVLQSLGTCPEVPEEQLEAYAVLTAMGSTYLWFQLYELINLGESFGLGPQAVRDGIADMVTGAVATMVESGLKPAQVMDLVPVKPLGDDEAMIRELYRNKLTALHAKLKSW